MHKLLPRFSIGEPSSGPPSGDDAGADAHALQLPPQSTPVSSPFCAESEQVKHALQLPPQSMPVSSPFCAESEQEANPSTLYPAWPVITRVSTVVLMLNVLAPATRGRMLAVHVRTTTADAAMLCAAATTAAKDVLLPVLPANSSVVEAPPDVAAQLESVLTSFQRSWFVEM